MNDDIKNEIAIKANLGWRSKFDGSYISDETMLVLIEKGITDQVQTLPNGGTVACIGFCPKEQKWFGWSHRAIYGFEIGSKVSKGDCNYTANNPQDMIDDYANFFADISQESADRHRRQCIVLPDESGIIIAHSGYDLPIIDINDINKYLSGEQVDTTTQNVLSGVEICKNGKGEWTATTLDEAKQMAIDFAESVS